MISLLHFDVLVVIAIFGVMLFAGLIHGTLGLGFPMVATPMLAAMMDVRSAILITLLPTMAVNIASIMNSKSSLASTKPFLPLAGLILLYLWNGIRIPQRWLLDNSLLAMAVFGLIAGISAGTTNVMVAILIIYFMSLETPRSTLVPALNSCFLVGKISQIVVLAIAGLLSVRLTLETAPLAVAAVVALLLGQRLQPRIQVSTYQSILRKLLLLLSIVLIYQFLTEVDLISW
jgi:uncharacterized membrane protein YfcA